MHFLKSKRKQEKILQITLVIITLVMTIFRFLLNEKGRVSPDSIRFMRFAHVFPTIDNTTTPLGYPLAIKFFTLFGFDEFWSSKIIGVITLLSIIFFAKWKNFYLKEIICTCCLFSFLSLFSFTLSESLFIVVIFIFMHISSLVLNDDLNFKKGIVYITLSLIILYNIRYSGLFIIGATGLYGLIYWKKKYGKIFLISGCIGFVFVVVYKLTFIDYFNPSYVQHALEIGVYSTSQLIIEFFQGICTSFNPFIHIASPTPGLVNIGIYSVGAINILVIILLFIKFELSKSEKFYVFVGISGIVCSYFIQYFYTIDSLNYRLLGPFNFLIWLVYFSKLFQFLGIKTYIIPILSLCSGFIFTWLSRASYIDNRKKIAEFLASENLINTPILYYVNDLKNLDEIQIAEIISTVNPNISITLKPQDTINLKTLTEKKVIRKIKISKNKYQ